MSIQKKSLISSLKTTKKANVAAAPGTDAKKETVSSLSKRSFQSTRQATPKAPTQFANLRTVRFRTLKAVKD